MLDRPDLHEYQNRGVEFIKSEGRVFLMLAMGMGKSSITLTAVSDLLDSFSVNKVLIVAPLRVANSVWRQEAKKWKHLKHMKFQLCIGDQKTRLKALHHDSEIYIINRENITWLVDHYGKKWPFDMLVIDESSSFKSGSSKRFKSLKKVLHFTDNIVLLTGTPSPNGLLDLWSQAYLIDYGQSLGKTMSAYKQRFFESDYMGYSFKPKASSQAIIENLMRSYTLSMQAEDYLELPDRIDLIESIDLTPAVLAQYKEFEKNLFMEVDKETIEAINAAVLANKMIQFSNGAMYTDIYKNWIEIHTAKIDALAEIIELNDEPILVAYNFKSDLERLQLNFPTGVVLDTDDETIRRWNKGQTKLLFAHPQSASHGLNLQHGGSLVVWFSLNWNLEYYQQFNARLHRQGQTKPVRIVHLVVNDTIDERVIKVLGEKDATQASLMKALK